MRMLIKPQNAPFNKSLTLMIFYKIGLVGKDCSSLVKNKNQLINYRVVYAPGSLDGGGSIALRVPAHRSCPVSRFPLLLSITTIEPACIECVFYTCLGDGQDLSCTSNPKLNYICIF